MEVKDLKNQLHSSNSSSPGVVTDSPRLFIQTDMQRKLDETQRLLQQERESKKKLMLELDELKKQSQSSASKNQLKQDVNQLKRATSNYNLLNKKI